MLILIGLVAIVALTVATAYFVAQVFAYIAVDRSRLRVLAERGDAAAERALKITSRLSFMLSGAQLGITVTALLTGYVAEPYLGQGLADLVGLAGVPRGASLSISVVVALLVATVVQMVFGELAAKNLAIALPEALARALSRSTLVYLAIARLVTLNGLANACLRAVKVTPQDELAQAHGPQELRMLIASSREHGTLAASEHDLLTAMLQVQNTTVAQVMTPAAQVVTVPAAAAARQVELASRAAGRSRLAAVEPGGRICGIVHLRDAARATTVGEPATAAELMTAPLTLADRTRTPGRRRGPRDARAARPTRPRHRRRRRHGGDRRVGRPAGGSHR
jgi:CBS domain containing-hemolysin-like protein